MEETEILKTTRKQFSKIGLILFGGAIFCSILQLVVSFSFMVSSPNLANNPTISLLINMIPLYALGLPCIIYFLKPLPSKETERHSLTCGQWLQAFCICYALMYVGNVLGLISTEFIGYIKGGTVENIVDEIIANTSPWVTIPFTVILAPIFEEYIFRKLIINRTALYGEGIAIFISALLFGLFHGNLNQFAYAFILGLFWGFLYVKTRNVKYTIMMHMGINFLGSVPAMLLMRSKFLQDLSNLNPGTDIQNIVTSISEHAPELMIWFTYSILVMILLITGLILFFINLRKIHLSPGEIVIPKGTRFRTVICNPGMLLNIGFWGFMILLQLLG